MRRVVGPAAANSSPCCASGSKKLDPLSLIINANLGDAYLLARRYDLAVEQGRKTLEIDSNFGVAHSNLGRAYVQKEMYREAISEFQAADASALADWKRQGTPLMQTRNL